MAGSALILGTLPGQVDAIHHLQSHGWIVHACGHERQGPGVDVADDFFQVDIVDDQAVSALAQRLGSRFVYSVGSDIAMPTIARVSEKLNLPRFHDTTITDLLRRKDRLRAFLNQSGINRVAHSLVVNEGHLDGFTDYPAIVKPTDSQGQRGITIVKDRAEASAALPAALAASRTGTAVIEQLLDGPEVSVHVFVVDGRVRFFLPSDRHVWDGPLVGIPIAHTLPSRWMTTDDEHSVRTMLDQLVTALQIRTGPLYVQLRLTSRDGPRIIEIASRLDGCHLWRLLRAHTGFDLLRACFDLLAGKPWVDPAPWQDDTVHELRFWLASPTRPFYQADHPLPDDGTVLHYEYQVDEGALPRDVNGIVSRLGYSIVEVKP